MMAVPPVTRASTPTPAQKVGRSASLPVTPNHQSTVDGSSTPDGALIERSRRLTTEMGIYQTPSGVRIQANPREVQVEMGQIVKANAIDPTTAQQLLKALGLKKVEALEIPDLPYHEVAVPMADGGGRYESFPRWFNRADGMDPEEQVEDTARILKSEIKRILSSQSQAYMIITGVLRLKHFAAKALEVGIDRFLSEFLGIEDALKHAKTGYENFRRKEGSARTLLTMVLAVKDEDHDVWSHLLNDAESPINKHVVDGRVMTKLCDWIATKGRGVAISTAIALLNGISYQRLVYLRIQRKPQAKQVTAHWTFEDVQVLLEGKMTRGNPTDDELDYLNKHTSKRPIAIHPFYQVLCEASQIVAYESSRSTAVSEPLIIIDEDISDDDVEKQIASLKRKAAEPDSDIDESDGAPPMKRGKAGKKGKAGRKGEAGKKSEPGKKSEHGAPPGKRVTRSDTRGSTAPAAEDETAAPGGGKKRTRRSRKTPAVVDEDEDEDQSLVLGHSKFFAKAGKAPWRLSAAEQDALRLSVRSVDGRDHVAEDGFVQIPLVICWHEEPLPASKVSKLGSKEIKTLRDIFDVELAMYTWHNRHGASTGALKNCTHSLTQMVLRQDPLLYAIAVAHRPDREHRLISINSYLRKFTTQMVLDHIGLDLDVKAYLEGTQQGNYVDMEVVFGLESERSLACYLSGMQRIGSLKAWLEYVSDTGPYHEGDDRLNPAQAANGRINFFFDNMWTDELAEVDPDVRVVTSQALDGAVRVKSALVPSGVRHNKGGHKYVIPIHYRKYDAGNDEFEVSGFNLRDHLESLRAKGNARRVRFGPHGFHSAYDDDVTSFEAAEVWLSVGPMSRRMVGLCPYETARDRFEVELFLTDANVRGRVIQSYRREVLHYVPDAFANLVVMEQELYGENSFFRRLEQDELPLDWLTSSFEAVQGDVSEQTERWDSQRDVKLRKAQNDGVLLTVAEASWEVDDSGGELAGGTVVRGRGERSGRRDH